MRISGRAPVADRLRLHAALAALVICASLSSCIGEDSDGVVAPDVPGPCVHYYLSPIVMVTGVTAAETGDPVDTIHITSVKLDGTAIPFFELLADVTTGVELVDGVLECRVPFGFGTREGHYAFDVSAPGRTASAVTVDAAYESLMGGCPSYSDGPTEVTISLGAE